MREEVALPGGQVIETGSPRTRRIYIENRTGPAVAVSWIKDALKFERG
jgi:hypothetical protein